MSGSLSSILKLPAVRFSLFLSAGIILSEYLHFEASETLTVAGALIFCVILLFVLLIRWKSLCLIQFVALAALVITCGIFLGNRTHDQIDTSLLRFSDTKERVIIRGIVVDQPSAKHDRISFVLTTMDIRMDTGFIPLVSRTIVYYSISAFKKHDSLTPVRTGDTLELEGILRSARSQSNPAGFDFRKYLRRQNVVTTLSVYGGERVKILGKDAGFSFVRTPVSAIREYLRDGVRRYYSADNIDIMEGLILGERGRIRDEITEAFRDAGVIHILAVSGLHVGIILSLIWIPLGRIRFTVRAVIAVTVLWLYAILTGMAPPVTRAVIMATVILFGIGIQRTSNSINALAMAGSIILLLSPQDIFLASFQLSFAAVFSILIFYSRVSHFMEKKFPRLWERTIPKYILSLLAMTFAAQIGTAPFIILYFGQFSLVSFAANLAVVPLVFVVVATGLPALLFSFFGTFPSDFLAASSGFALSIIVNVSSFLAGLPFAVLRVGNIPFWAAITYIAIMMIAFSKPSRLRYKLVLAVSFIISVYTLVSAFSTDDRTDGKLRVTFLDVGQGDAALIELPNGNAMLIDTGPVSKAYDTGKRTILPFLHMKGIQKISALIFTHPDNDHIGGAGTILDALDVERVFYSYKWKDDPLAIHVDSLMREEKALLQDLRAGSVLNLDQNARLYLLSPPVEDNGDFASNNSSSVILLVYGQTKFLFTGDAEKEAEQEMVRRYGDFLKADVLKVGHHGSSSSTTPAFILKVKPKDAVISCGRLNRFNHPRQEILTRLKIIGAEVHRTDYEGAIVFESDGITVSKIDWRK